MNYQIPQRLINKDNVFVKFNEDTCVLSVELSKRLIAELKFWPDYAIENLENDINTSLKTFLFEAYTPMEMECVYSTVFRQLSQIY